MSTGQPAVDGFVIVVDQFEEVFTDCADEGERGAFVRALCAVAAAGSTVPVSPADAGMQDPPHRTVLVVLGLRSDFYDHALRHEPLALALQRRQVIVGPMTESELRRAIVEPALRAGVDIEEGLVALLLRDITPTSATAHEAGALPLLSHALLATWEIGHRRRLRTADYQETGGIRGPSRTARKTSSQV